MMVIRPEEEEEEEALRSISSLRASTAACHSELCNHAATNRDSSWPLSCSKFLPILVLLFFPDTAYKISCKSAKGCLTKVCIHGSIEYLLSVISDQIQHIPTVCAHQCDCPHTQKLQKQNKTKKPAMR
jgi:hypothetical protein